MEKVIDYDNLIMLLIPLSDEHAYSLEEHLSNSVAKTRGKDEFVAVIADAISPSLIVYGLCEADRFCEATREEVKGWIVSNGREWMRNNDFPIYN